MLLLSAVAMTVVSCEPRRPAQEAPVADQPIEEQVEDTVRTLFVVQDAHGDRLQVTLQPDTASGAFKLCCNGVPCQFLNDSLWDDDPVDESDIFRMSYFRSPGDRWLYVALNPSIAGSCDIFTKIRFYQIDLWNQRVKFLFNCGAVKLTHDGFMIARQVRWLNPDASCAEARFTAQQVYYDFDAHQLRCGPEQSEDEVWKAYDSVPLPEEWIYELNATHNVITNH